VVAEDASIVFADWVVAAGSGQAGVTHGAYTSNGVFQGVAGHQHKDRRDDGTAGYQAGDTVNVVRKDKLLVKVSAAVVKDEVAYLNVQVDGKEGYFTNVSSNNLATGGVFRTTAAQDANAELEINLP
jgi:hypothetical protein